jgi:large subunit ribosomal protein L10
LRLPAEVGDGISKWLIRLTFDCFEFEAPPLSRGGILLAVMRPLGVTFQVLRKGGIVDLVKPGKIAAVDELKKKLEKAQGVVLVDYRGLNVGSLTNLRRRLDESEGEFRVVKNTLTIIAAKDIGIEDLDQYLEGPTAIAFAYEDPAEVARIINDFTREFRELGIKGGTLLGKVIGPDDVRSLALLPPRDVMLGHVAAAFAAPMSGFARALSGIITNFAYAVDAVRRQKEETAA